MAIHSATGVANQMPDTPNKIGNPIKQITIKTKDLENANTADTNPLFNAVNMPLEKILKPKKNKAMLQI